MRTILSLSLRPGIIALGFLVLIGALPHPASAVTPGLIVLRGALAPTPAETTGAAHKDTGTDPGGALTGPAAELNVSLSKDAFGSGSDPVTILPMSFQGTSIPTSPSGLLDPGDTVLELYAASEDSTFSNEFHGIRIVALHLVSAQPVTVTYNGGNDPEEWDVEACLSKGPQRGGFITLVRDQVDMCGGSFSYALAVTPKLVFTRRGDGERLVLDPGGTAFLSFTAKGRWIDRSYLAAYQDNLVDVPEHVVIDADCSGTFDQDEQNANLPESSTLVLGATCTKSPGVFPTWLWWLSPLTQETVQQSQSVEPATRSGVSFPGTGVDRLASRKDPHSEQSHGHTLVALAGLALLGGAAVMVPSRRREKNGE